MSQIRQPKKSVTAVAAPPAALEAGARAALSQSFGDDVVRLFEENGGMKGVLADAELQRRYADILDSACAQRAVDVRNALRGLGWDTKPGKANWTPLMKDGIALESYGFPVPGAAHNNAAMGFRAWRDGQKASKVFDTGMDVMEYTAEEMAKRLDQAIRDGVALSGEPKLPDAAEARPTGLRASAVEIKNIQGPATSKRVAEAWADALKEQGLIVAPGAEPLKSLVENAGARLATEALNSGDLVRQLQFVVDAMGVEPARRLLRSELSSGTSAILLPGVEAPKAVEGEVDHSSPRSNSDRPAVVKLTEAQRRGTILRLTEGGGPLREGSEVAFQRIGNNPKDYMVFAVDQREGEPRVVDISRDVAFLAKRQTDRFMLRVWDFDKPAEIVKELEKALGFNLKTRVL